MPRQRVFLFLYACSEGRAVITEPSIKLTALSYKYSWNTVCQTGNFLHFTAWL